MNFLNNVTVKLVCNGIIVHQTTNGNGNEEFYDIHDASVYADDGKHCIRQVPLSSLWLIWNGSVPLLAVLIYLRILVFGQ